MFKDFHYPSTLMSSFKAQEEELRSQYNKDGFAREILAEFYENSSKVFLSEDIRRSFLNYQYTDSIDQLETPENWIVTLGYLIVPLTTVMWFETDVKLLESLKVQCTKA